MSGSRTEKPTPRRLRESRRRGEVASSRELVAAASLVAGAAAATAPSSFAFLARQLRSALEAAARGESAPGQAIAASAESLARVGAAPLGAAALASVAAGLLASGFLFSPEVLRPHLERVDPFAGLRRLLAPARLLDLALGAAKAGIAVGVGLHFLRGCLPSLAELPRRAAPALLPLLPGLLMPLVWRLGVLSAAFGLLELALARHRHARALRMSREEVLREHREEEGDPRLRADRRRTHQALAAAGPVARASVLVVNPTHLAVALAHRRGSDDAPRVLAKGAGPGAARLRAQARRAGVPVVRDVALARSLFRLAEVGEAIPEELYQAAAAVLVQVHGHTAELP